MIKFIKKKDLITDEGVSQHGNHVDVAIILTCTILSLTLIALVVMVYVEAF